MLLEWMILGNLNNEYYWNEDILITRRHLGDCLVQSPHFQSGTKTLKHFQFGSRAGDFNTSDPSSSSFLPPSEEIFPLKKLSAVTGGEILIHLGDKNQLANL